MEITEVLCQVLRIKNVESKTASTQDTLLVRIQTNEGIEGGGECDAQPEVCKAVIDSPFSHNIAWGLRILILGENPLDTERIWEKMYRGSMYYGRRGVTIATMAAVDMALWDIKGKKMGQPIHQLLGGKKHDNIKAYASILFGRDGVETKEIGQRWIEAGYKAVKFGWEPMGESEAMDLDLVYGAREGLGANADLLVDAGCVWDRTTALKRAEKFTDYNIGWLEEPLSQDDLEGYQWLRERSPVAIAAGEGECGWYSYKPWVENQLLDIYQVDLARNGFTEAKRIADKVEEQGAKLCNHCYKTPISVAACLHWLSTTKTAFLFEDCVEDSALRHELTYEKMQAIDGTIQVPDSPGLGVTLNEDLIQELLVVESK